MMIVLRTMIVVTMNQIRNNYPESRDVNFIFSAEEMTIIDEIKQKIGEKPVFIISKEYCPFCVKAKDALKNYNIKAECIEIMEIENNPDMDEIQDFMKQLTGGRSVPRVFIGGKFIGGGDETMTAHKNGNLGKMLKEAGAL